MSYLALCARCHLYPTFISAWEFLSLAKIFICLTMLEWDLTGPSSFCSGFEPNFFGETEKEASSYCLLSNMISVLKTFVPFVPEEPSFATPMYP